MRTIVMDQEHWDLMVEHIKKWYPEEACGLLGGVGQEVLDVITVTNVLHSPTRYRMDPREQLAAMQSLEENGQSIIGIFHSHVNGPEGLSYTELREASYPEAAYLVWSKLNRDWKCKGFRVEDGRGIELQLVVRSK